MIDPNEDKKSEPEIYEEAAPLEIDADAFGAEIGKYQQLLTDARKKSPPDDAENGEEYTKSGK